MKTLYTTAISLFALAANMFAAGADYKILKITPQLIHTPVYSYQGDLRRSPGPSQQWLEVEVEFQAAPDFTDELTFKYYIWFGDKLLTGEVTHVNIPAGRELYSVVYVSPKTMSNLLNKKAVSLNAVENVGVQILSKGQLLDELSYKPGRAQWWQAMQQTPGFVLNKSQTPFAPLYWDRYEAIKSDVR